MEPDARGQGWKRSEQVIQQGSQSVVERADGGGPSIGRQVNEERQVGHRSLGGRSGTSAEHRRHVGGTVAGSAARRRIVPVPAGCTMLS
jgi:hypothetical protein